MKACSILSQEELIMTAKKLVEALKGHMKAKVQQPKPIPGGPVPQLTADKIREIAAASGSKTYSDIILKRYGLEESAPCNGDSSKVKP